MNFINIKGLRINLDRVLYYRCFNKNEYRDSDKYNISFFLGDALLGGNSLDVSFDNELEFNNIVKELDGFTLQGSIYFKSNFKIP